MHRNTDGARLVSDRAGNRLTNPPGCVGGEFITTTVFEFIYRFHQTDVAFLNQIEELQTTVGVFFSDGNNQTQVGLNHFFLGATGAGFTDGYATVNFFNFRNAQTNAFFNGADFLLRTENFQTVGVEFFRVAVTGSDQAIDPFVADFITLKFFDEVFTVHAALTGHHHHDLAFLGTDQIQGIACTVNQ